MNIEDRKKICEEFQSENLLFIISKEVFPQKITPDERDKKDRPDIKIGIDNKTIGIELTGCYPSNYIDDKNKNGQQYKLRTYKWLKSECKKFMNSPYFISLTKDQCYSIQIYNTNAVYHGNHHNEYQKELIEHIEAIRFRRYPIKTKLIDAIRVKSSPFNYVDWFHTSCPVPVKWKDILREIEKKERQSQSYEPTDELWLNIYIPWEENIISYEIDIENSKLDTVRERLNQSKFQRIYLSSIREQDIFVLKTTNGEDMLNEDHCINVSK